mgnify:FL=1
MEIQENLDNGKLDEAVHILQESKILDKEYPGPVSRYSEQLVSIYEIQPDKEAFVYSLDRYEKVLKEKFPEPVRDIYISYPHFESERADNRSRYRELMKYLKKIQRYPGGKERRLRLRRTGRLLLWHGRQRKRTKADDCAYKHIKRFETGQKR